MLRKKDPEFFHIRGAALDQIAGTVGTVPGKGQTDDMSVEPVSGSFDKTLGAKRVKQFEEIACSKVQQGKDHHQNGAHAPAHFSVYGDLDQLRIDKIQKRRETGKAYAKKIKPFISFEKIK